MLNDEQINYICSILNNRIQSINKAFEDNFIFSDWIEANEEIEMLESILGGLYKIELFK